MTEVKTKPSELDATTPDFIPLHMTPKPKVQDNNPEPNAKNGNGLEKNGQKRIQTAPIDATDGSKKARINTPGHSNVGTEKEDGDHTDLSKKADGDHTDLSRKGDGDHTDLSRKGDEEEMDQYSDTEEFYLTVNNLPTDWTYVQIKNYLDQECGHVDEMEMLKHRKSKNCAIRLTFQSVDKCVDVFKKLENKFVQDKKLKVKISDTYTTFPTGVTVPNTIPESIIKQCSISNEIIAATRWRPDLDSLDTDPEGLYGLRPEFLKALGIKPPLNKMVHVTNFRCDKNELKEVMEMAGNVLMCCVIATLTKYAKVMYSHPLEAVQAISMLNGQLYYGAPLKITIDKNPADSVVLPKGLANIGQGLGIKAKPIRNIVQQYQRYASKQSSLINPILFSEVDFSDDYINKIKEDNSAEIEKNIKEFISSRPGCNILNPTVPFKVQNIDQLECPDSSMDASDITTPETSIGNNRRGGKKKSVGSPQDQTKKASPQLGAPANPLVRPIGPAFMNPNMMLSPPVPMHNPLPIPGPREPFFRPGNNLQEPRPFRPRVPFVPPPMQRPPFPQPRPPFGPPAGMRPPISPLSVNGPRANLGNRVTVKFANLPPSTTFPFLCDLLAKCGQVMSVQLTTPGCAVATFGHPSHAERCFQSFNGMNVEGFVIEVAFA